MRYAPLPHHVLPRVEPQTLRAHVWCSTPTPQAIVDDISVAILHTAVGQHSPRLLPRMRSTSAGGLSHAASCNDRANGLYESWRADRSSCLHSRSQEPEGFFDVFPAASAEPSLAAEEGGPLPAAAWQAAHARTHALPVPAAATAAAAATGAPTPAADDTLAGLSASMPDPGALAGLSLAAEERAGRGGRRRGGGRLDLEPFSFSLDPGQASPVGSPRRRWEVRRLEDSPSAQRSPRSSLALTDGSNPSSRRGDAYGTAGAEGGVTCSLPVSLGGLAAAAARGGSGDSGVLRTSSAPIAALLPPIRKAYPSSQGLQSYKSDASMLSGETHASCEGERGSRARGGAGAEGGPRHEGKVRGGMPRSLSAPGLSPLLSASTMRYSSDSLSQG